MIWKILKILVTSIGIILAMGSLFGGADYTVGLLLGAVLMSLVAHFVPTTTVLKEPTPAIPQPLQPPPQYEVLGQGPQQLPKNRLPPEFEQVIRDQQPQLPPEPQQYYTPPIQQPQPTIPPQTSEVPLEPIKPRPTAPKPLNCQFCGAGMGNGHQLNLHLLSKHKEKIQILE